MGGTRAPPLAPATLGTGLRHHHGGGGPLNTTRLSPGGRRGAGGTAAMGRQHWVSPTRPALLGPAQLPANMKVTTYVNRCNAAHVEPILEFVVALSDHMISLSFSGKKKILSFEDLSCISHVLKDDDVIKEVDFSGTNIGSDAAGELAEAIKLNYTLVTVELSNCGIGSEGAVKIASGMKANHTITRLSLKGNQLSNHGAAALADTLLVNGALTDLDLEQNDIKCQGAVALAASLKINKSLQSLNLRFNKIANVGAVALGMALKLNTTLTLLDLGGNSIEDQGASAIAAGLSANPSLKKLNLRLNKLGDTSAVLFAEALSNTHTLEEIFLGCNPEITSVGCTAIADALKDSTGHSLKKLDLQGLKMGRDGTLAVADMLRKNNSLQHLIIDLGSDSLEECDAIAQAIQSNTSLTELYPGNIAQVNQKILTAIAQTLHVNRFVAGIVGETQFDQHLPFKLSQQSPGQIEGSAAQKYMATMKSKLQSLQDQVSHERSIAQQAATMGATGFQQTQASLHFTGSNLGTDNSKDSTEAAMLRGNSSMDSMLNQSALQQTPLNNIRLDDGAGPGTQPNSGNPVAPQTLLSQEASLNRIPSVATAGLPADFIELVFQFIRDQFIGVNQDLASKLSTMIDLKLSSCGHSSLELQVESRLTECEKRNAEMAEELSKRLGECERQLGELSSFQQQHNQLELRLAQCEKQLHNALRQKNQKQKEGATQQTSPTSTTTTTTTSNSEELERRVEECEKQITSIEHIVNSTPGAAGESTSPSHKDEDYESRIRELEQKLETTCQSRTGMETRVQRLEGQVQALEGTVENENQISQAALKAILADDD
ncbi:leucine-rich repeat protein [Pelomyxa schiedti]|nr:leucine-rich repeat protein [Pelomyxa schiedti]